MFTRGTRVIALGESVHDSHDFIVLRTRLTEQLVQRGLVAALVTYAVGSLIGGATGI